MDPEAFFAGHPDALEVYRTVRAMVDGIGPSEVRATRSQVAFRRRRGFAYLWLPGGWLTNPAAEVVLSVALARHDESPRFKQVAHPAHNVWLHHLGVRTLDQLDDELLGWLREAYADAA